MDFKKIFKTSLKTIVHGLILSLMFSLSGISFLLLFFSYNEPLVNIVSIILLLLNTMLFYAYGRNFWKISGLEKPVITVKYDKKNNRMIILSCDDADKCVDIKTIIEDED